MDQHAEVFRTGARHDIPAFLEIMASVEDRNVLMAPDFPPRLDVLRFLRTQLRLPRGMLGYRNALVLEADGEVAGFLIGVPLAQITGYVGSLLPEDLARARYGDLKSLLHIHVIGVASAHRRKKIATRLLARVAEYARENHYKYLIGHDWVSNTPGFLAKINFGFIPVYQQTYRRPSMHEDSFVIFDFDLSKVSSASK